MTSPSRAMAVESLTPFEARLEHQDLAAEIAAHDLRYHQQDAPVITDADYDQLRLRLLAIEAGFPELRSAVALSVGAKPSEKFAKVRHSVPMLSLANVFSGEEAGEFVDRIQIGRAHV